MRLAALFALVSFVATVLATDYLIILKDVSHPQLVLIHIPQVSFDRR